MALTDAEQIEYLRLLEEEDKHRSRTRLFSLYPETGPLRRALYPKHLRHFAAGADFNERAATGGNRCLTLGTPIETRAGERLIEEIADGRDFGVVSWVDGRRCAGQASPVYLKGIEPAYRLRIDNGMRIECSARHRMMTVEGWVSLAQLVSRADGTLWPDSGFRRRSEVSGCAILPALDPFQLPSGVLDWLHAGAGLAALLLSGHPPLVGGNRILSIEGIGLQPIVDFEVAGSHNYMAGGVVHHNSGKTLCCSYETVCHLIGWYPQWWEGFRFDRAISAWAAGEDTKSVRESLQTTFLGPPQQYGTGLIPHAALASTTPRSGVPDAVDSVTVKSAWGGMSRLMFKSYDQGRESFQAAKVDVVQFDEEPPMSIYTEGLTRTMATVPGERNGLVICGFTPLRGLSEVVLSYMPGGQRTEGAVV